MPASDRPDDRTIENDDAIDRWFEQYQRHAARKAGRSGPTVTLTEAADQIPSFSPD